MMNKALAYLGLPADLADRPRPTQEKHLSLRVDSELSAALEALAAEGGISVSQYVRAVLKEAVSRRRDASALDLDALTERMSADVAEVRRRLVG
jgi:antitoxin component of RelBE/YafQ-DinJ toxin-antitoxin module